jgi:hypothetical protein
MVLSGAFFLGKIFRGGSSYPSSLMVVVSTGAVVLIRSLALSRLFRHAGQCSGKISPVSRLPQGQ